MSAYRWVTGLFVVFSFACGDSGANPDAGADVDAGPPPAPELGTGDHTPASVTLTPIATAADGLASPRDLAFNPRIPDELWIVNHDTESVVIVHAATDDTNRSTEKRKDGYALHFMAKPAAIDFGADATSTAPIPIGVAGKPGTFATCGESRNTYDDTQAANDFMGPVLWSSDLSVFAKYNPNGLGSHLDMAHLSSDCVGIAHETGNAYWTISGRHETSTMPMNLPGAVVTRYDFNADNGVGNDDHSDNVGEQFSLGVVTYKAGVSSHLFWNADEPALYIADAGSGRILRLDPSTATKGANLMAPETMARASQMANESFTEVVSAGVLSTPSGLEIKNSIIYVSDNDTSLITAFSLDGQTQLNYLDTGLPPGSLSGMAFGPDGKLYFVDVTGNNVFRIDPN